MSVLMTKRKSKDEFSSQAQMTYQGKKGRECNREKKNEKLHEKHKWYEGRSQYLSAVMASRTAKIETPGEKSRGKHKTN